jgi:transcriptional regulator with XRE-family HTH domain
MPLLKELGAAVRQRRQEIGLSQEALARMSGLSRTTIVNLENGALNNLASTRIEALANSLGFAVGLLGPDPARNGGAIAAAARVASVPYRKQLPTDVLRDALIHGIVPPGYIPQMRTLLQEAPVATLAGVAEELEHDSKVPRPATWARMRALAGVLKCERPIWNTEST